MNVTMTDCKLKFIRTFTWGCTAKIGASGQTQAGEKIYADIGVKAFKDAGIAMGQLTETDTPTLIGFFSVEQYEGKNGTVKQPCFIVQEVQTGKQTAPKPSSRPAPQRRPAPQDDI